MHACMHLSMHHVCLVCVQPVNEPCMRAFEHAACVLDVRAACE